MAQRRAKQTEIKRVSVSSEQGFRQMCSQMCTTSLVQSVTALLNSEDLDGADSSTGRLFLLVYKSIVECSWDSIRADPCFWIHVADAPCRLCLRPLFHFTAAFQMWWFVPQCGSATEFFCIWWRHPVRICSVRLSYCFARSHLIVFGFWIYRSYFIPKIQTVSNKSPLTDINSHF